MRTLARGYAYVLPGLPIAVFSFSLLVAMTAVSLATLAFWIGALLLPLTLMVGSAFAELDRRRLHVWGAATAPVTYLSVGPELMAKLRILLDPRRWLDLVFEMLLAFPLRLVTFTVAVAWSVAGPAWVTYFIWSLFLPESGSAIQVLWLTAPGLVPEGPTAQYLLDAGTHFLLGLIFLLTLPMVIRGLARLDATLTTALLGDGGRGVPAGSPTVTGRTQGPSNSRPAASFSGWAWAWIGTGFAVVVLFAAGWPLTAVLYPVGVSLAMVLVGAHCAAAVITLRWVWGGLTLSILASVGLIAATAGTEGSIWPWPVTAMITQCAVLSVAALAKPWYWAASGWCAGALLTLTALLMVSPGIPPGALSTGIVFVSLSAVVVILGILVRIWILNAGRLEAAQRTSADQDRRRKELQERNRIARELHDVVAHSMSVISVQAATAQYRHPGMDEAARGEFEEIAQSSRQALSEMRMLLSILRGNDEVPTAPEPGLEEIGGLIEATRSSGTPIRYRGPGQRHEDAAAELNASSATGLAAYRIVQEALSNALRHAPAAEIDVDLTVSSESAGGLRFRISVVNGAPPVPVTDPAPGAGLGLAGIRERASAVGGSVQTGPTDDGGFAVRAELPVETLPG